MRRLSACLLVLGWALASAPAQEREDVLYLQDGRERVGELVRVTDEAVVFRVSGEVEPTAFPRAEVQRVELGQARAGNQARQVDELKDRLIKRLLEKQPTAADYPDSGYVVLYRLHEYELHPDGTYTLRERRVEKVLQERGKERANVARYFRKGEETLRIDFARTINPDGTVTPISDAAVDITSVHADTPAYEKLYQAKFAMKQVQVDSVLDYRITIERTVPDPLLPFYASVLFRGREPIREAELRVIVPSGQNLNHRLDRAEDRVEMEVFASTRDLTYRFVARDCPRYVPEPQMPPTWDLFPRVTVSLPGTWEAVGAAYAEALSAALESTPELQTVVQETTAGAATPAERADRLYRHVITTVQHLPIPPADYSFAPRPVSETYTRRAGNAIDQAALLCALLEEAGLPAGVVLVCPQGRGRLLEDVPNLRQFADALVAVTLPEGRRFLALDNEATRFGQLPARVQGTRGLLVTRTGGELVDIPLNPPEAEQVTTEYELEVKPDGDVVVHKTARYTGNPEVNQRLAWKNLKEEERRREFEMAVGALHPKARLDAYALNNLDDLTRPLELTETYTLEEYALRAGDELLVFQLPEIDYSAASVGKPTREFPLRWSTRGRRANTMRIRIPRGYRVHYAGRDYNADAGVATFSATFRTEGDAIVYQDEYVQREVEAPVEAYAAYKACRETMARVPKEWIVLERPLDSGAR